MSVPENSLLKIILNGLLIVGDNAHTNLSSQLHPVTEQEAAGQIPSECEKTVHYCEGGGTLGQLASRGCGVYI